MHDVVLVGLSNKLQTLRVVEVNQSSESAADDLLLSCKLVFRDIDNFKHHCANKVHTFQQFQVDLEMWWHVSFLLLQLFF